MIWTQFMYFSTEVILNTTEVILKQKLLKAVVVEICKLEILLRT